MQYHNLRVVNSQIYPKRNSDRLQEDELFENYHLTNYYGKNMQDTMGYKQ